MNLKQILRLRSGDVIHLRPCYLIDGRQSRGAPVAATVLRWKFPYLIVGYNGGGLRGRLSIRQLFRE